MHPLCILCALRLLSALYQVFSTKNKQKVGTSNWTAYIPDYTKYGMTLVLDKIDKMLNCRKAVKKILVGMMGYIKRNLANTALKIEQNGRG